MSNLDLEDYENWPSEIKAIVGPDGKPMRRNQRNQKYPWDVWTDGRIHTITWKKDFTCSVQSMKVMLYQRAQRDSIAVWVQQWTNEDSTDVGVTFRFTNEPVEP